MTLLWIGMNSNTTASDETGADRVPPNTTTAAVAGSSDGALPFQCPSCPRSFSTKTGMGVHFRRAHPDDSDAAKLRAEPKRQWTVEERKRVAFLEATMLADGEVPILIHNVLAERHGGRTGEAIKSLRRRADYKDYREAAFIALTQRADVPEPAPETEDAELSQAIHNVVLPRSTRFNTDALMKVGESVMAGERSVTLNLLSEYLDEVFPAKPIRGGRRRAPPATSGNSRQRRKREYAVVQKRWSSQRSRLINDILNGQDEATMPRQNRMVPYWKSVFSSTTPCETETRPVIQSTVISPDVWMPITVAEIKESKVDSSTSPGPDGLTAKEWNAVPLEVRMYIYNIILWCRNVPPRYHKAHTSMIPKFSGAARPEDFRPITVGSVLCRGLHKVLARRLGRVDLHEAQRAFIRTDGTADNTTLMDALLRSSREEYRSLYMAQLDLSKAFDSVSHSAVMEALRGNRAPTGMVEYLEQVYRRQRTIIKGDGWWSDEIAPTRGVRQGDPLSPVVFNLIMDGLIRHLPPHIGYQLGGKLVSVVAYADDITLVAASPEGLQVLLSKVQEYLDCCGLKINAAKSRTLSFQGQPREKRQVMDASRKFSVGGRGLVSSSRSDKWKYLGVEYNGDGRLKVVEDISVELGRLDRAPLKPQQKLFALRTVLLPRLFHKISLGLVLMGRLKKLDNAVRAVVRKWLRLHHDVPVAYFHGAIRDGCLGIPSLRWFGPMLRFKRLTRINSNLAPGNSYLQRELEKAGRMTEWRGGQLTTTALISKMWSTRLLEKVDGIGLREAGKVGCSSQFIGDGSRLLSGRDFVHIVQTRIGQLYSRSRVTRGRNGVSRLCRAGCGHIETANHIAQVCRASKDSRLRRHNVLVGALFEEMTRKGYTPHKEPRIRGTNGRFFVPDLVGTIGNRAVIVDVTVVGDQVALNDAHGNKVAKYSSEEVAAGIREQFGSTMIPTSHSLTLNWRGIWSNESFLNLKLLGLVTDYTAKLYSIKAALGTYIGNRIFNGQELDIAEEETSALELSSSNEDAEV